MNNLRMIQIRYPGLVRWAWLALLLVLAACNQGSNDGGGGGPAY
jgi:hypothetical protein